MDERNNHFDFDFTPIGQAIKKAREAKVNIITLGSTPSHA